MIEAMRILVVMVALGVMMALPEGWRSNGFTLPAHPSRPMNPARTDLSTCSRAQGATCCQPLPTLGQTEAHEARRLRCQLRPPSGQTEARTPGAAKGSLLRRPRPGVGHTLYLPLLPSRAARPRNGIPRCPGQGGCCHQPLFNILRHLPVMADEMLPIMAEALPILAELLI